MFEYVWSIQSEFQTLGKNKVTLKFTPEKVAIILTDRIFFHAKSTPRRLVQFHMFNFILNNPHWQFISLSYFIHPVALVDLLCLVWTTFSGLVVSGSFFFFFCGTERERITAYGYDERIPM